MRAARLGRAVGLAIALASWPTINPGLRPAHAATPEGPPEPTWTAEQRQHWAFVPPRHPEPPAVKRESWARNPIDRFILEQLESMELEPAAEADRVALIRRVRFDLT